MYLLTKFGSHKSYGNKNINFYINKFLHEHLGKSWTQRLGLPYWEIFKIRNTDFQFWNAKHDWTQNEKKKEKKKKNTSSCKALDVSRKRSKPNIHA